MTGVIDQPVNTPEAWTLRAETLEEPWAACGWSRDGQRERFEAILWALDPNPGESLLDWGCGTGDLSELLADGVYYVGFDSATGMIERASAEHSADNRLFLRDVPSRLFDLVACIGPFNLPDHWSKQRTWHTMRHLWDTTRCRTLAVSLYAGDDGQCLQYTEVEARVCGRQLGYDVTIERTRANDLLLVARR